MNPARGRDKQDGGQHLASGRDIQAFPLLWRHEGGPWACRHRSLDRLQRVRRTGDVHSSCLRRNSATGGTARPSKKKFVKKGARAVDLPSPHKQPKETCPSANLAILIRFPGSEMACGHAGGRWEPVSAKRYNLPHPAACNVQQ